MIIDTQHAADLREAVDARIDVVRGPKRAHVHVNTNAASLSIDTDPDALEVENILSSLQAADRYMPRATARVLAHRILRRVAEIV